MAHILTFTEYYKHIYQDVSYLSKFHHHVSKDVQEAHNCVPQSAVRQRLLVTSAGTLTDAHKIHNIVNIMFQNLCISRSCKEEVHMKSCYYDPNHSHLDVLSQAVKDLLGHGHGFGEIPLTRLINDVFS